MYCKNCFKKISARSKFCKYCGAPVQERKKIKEEESETREYVQDTSEPSKPPEKESESKAVIRSPEPSKEYKFKLRSEKEKEFPIPPKVIGIVIGIVLVILAAVVFLRSSVFQSTDAVNYSDYIGVWQERGVEDVETSGGVRLEISSVDGSTMVISMTFYEGSAAYNSIQVQKIGAVLKDGAAYYTFSNDGYGNSGNGVLTFKGRNIEWKSVLNQNEAVVYEVVKVQKKRQKKRRTTIMFCQTVQPSI